MILERARKRRPYISFPWKPGTKFISLIAMFLLISFTCYKLKETRIFPIREVKVVGVQRADHLDIQNLVTPLVSKGFFAVQLEVIKDRLLQMPWVSEASVRRVWPDQILVTVAEREAIAQWNNHSLISSKGEIFSPSIATYPSGLPQLVGSDGEQLHILNYYAKIASLVEPLHSKIVKLEFTPDHSWQMTFDSGVKVNVGHKDVLTRIDHFVKVYPKIVGERAQDVAYVDLRYPNGLAVKWKTIT